MTPSLNGDLVGIWDGCVDSLEDLYVVAMLPWERTQERVHCMFLRRRGATAWESSEPLTPEQVARMEYKHRNNWPHIIVEPRGRVRSTWMTDVRALRSWS